MKLKFENRDFKENIVIKSNGINPVYNKTETKFYTNEELEDLQSSLDETEFLKIAIADQYAKAKNNEDQMDHAIQMLNLMTQLPDEVIGIIELIIESNDSRPIIGTLKQNTEVSKLDTYSRTSLMTYCHQYVGNRAYMKKALKKIKELEEELQSKEAEVRGETPL